MRQVLLDKVSLSENSQQSNYQKLRNRMYGCMRGQKYYKQGKKVE